MREQSIAAGFARALLDLAVSKGADRALLLQRSGIDAGLLADQDNRVPLVTYMALMRAGKELGNDPALALHFGETYDMSELSIVGLIGQACDGGAEAFAQLGRYNKLIADVEFDGPPDGERMVLSREGGEIWLVDRRSNPNVFPELTESSFARMISTARRYGTADTIKAVHVTHREPSYRTEYDRIFKLPVVFASDRNALRIDERALGFRPPQPSRYVFGILSERAESLLRELENTKTVRGKVESLLVPVLHKGDASMERIAGEMGMSRQTLFRKLKAEGTTFERLLDALRHKMALNYLNGKKVSVNETAYLVGFSEPAAFSRAFKRWTGTSPRTFRG
jgi:AraC-like DNA-binding protein